MGNTEGVYFFENYFPGGGGFWKIYTPEYSRKKQSYQKNLFEIDGIFLIVTQI